MAARDPSPAAERDLRARVEDYHSDGEGPSPEERRSPAANVAAKRSHHSDLGSEKPVVEKVVNIDLQSDSGYSSHTAATMSSSADSATSAKASSPSTAPSSAASYPPSSPAASRRRPTLVPEDRKSSSQSSPRKPLQRTASVASKRTSVSRRAPAPSEDCTDPDCTKCAPNPLPPALDSSYPSFDQRSQRSDPAPSYTSPPSPTYSRQPAHYVHGPTVVQPAQTRRRSSTAQRPVSYHEGQGYWPIGMPAPYPSPPQDHHGPPPSMSAHYGMHPSQQMSPYSMGPVPPNFYAPGHPAQTSPPYEHQRPPLSARASSSSNSYQTRRPQSGLGPPALVTYDRSDPPMPSARFHDAPPRSARQERFPQAQSESESSDYSSSEEEEQRPARSDRALMPPPKLRSNKDKERRPSLRHANTTQVYNERRLSTVGMSQSSMLPERPRERDPRASRVSTAASSRAASMSRPALIQHPKAQSAYATPRPAKVLVENSKSRRRQSYQAYNKEYLAEQKRRNRDSKIYREDQDDSEDAITERPRRRTDAATAGSRRDEYVGEPKERRAAMDAEAYQRSTRGTNEPFTDTVHKAAKRTSHVPSGPSEAGSNRSGDRKTRVSQSAHTTVTNGAGNGEIRLRVDASAPLSLQFNGDMEGRTLQINPAEGGMADIVIGSSRGDENVYRSERGSAVGNHKSLLAGSARRDLEESSVRSGRSSQSRRARDREAGEPRPLRRRQTEYN